MPLEIETKFKIRDLKAFKISLNKLKPQLLYKRTESDIYYSPPYEMNNISVIRLRCIGKNGIFTVKGPSKQNKRNLKIKEENEIEINDIVVFKKILSDLGYKEALIKEKKRECYELGDVLLMLDKLPFLGNYIEIEGDKKDIINTAERLGLDFKRAIAETYLSLFQKYKVSKKVNNIKLTFASEKNNKNARELY